MLSSFAFGARSLPLRGLKACGISLSAGCVPRISLAVRLPLDVGLYVLVSVEAVRVDVLEGLLALECCAFQKVIMPHFPIPVAFEVLSHAIGL